jgi:hypothetical protein
MRELKMKVECHEHMKAQCKRLEESLVQVS